MRPRTYRCTTVSSLWFIHVVANCYIYAIIAWGLSIVRVYEFKIMPLSRMDAALRPIEQLDDALGLDDLGVSINNCCSLKVYLKYSN